MLPVDINYIAVVVAAVIAYALGALWYGPLFGRIWMQLSGKTEATLDKSNMGVRYVIGFVTSLVMAYVLAHLIEYARAATIVEGLQTGFWVWLGFVATVSLGMVLWEGKPFKLWVLNNAYNLFSLLVMGAIIAGV
jgi:hypothetical protein